ncbi:MAG: DUF6788 family protein [Acidimicrobiales bacterium]
MTVAQPNAKDQAARAAIAARLAEAGFALPGSLVERTARCGKPNCSCRADPPKLHGPYHQWTRKIDGKTATINLTDDQLERYGPWFEEAQRLRRLLNELEELSFRLASRSEGWGLRNSR